MQYNANHAVMSSNASDARKVLKKVTKGTWTNKGCTIDPCVIAGAAGVAFTTLRRMEGSTQGFGNGFVLARYPDQTLVLTSFALFPVGPEHNLPCYSQWLKQFKGFLSQHEFDS